MGGNSLEALERFAATIDETAGAPIGIAGMCTAIVMIAAATSEGAEADPVVSRAVTTASMGLFLVSAMGFAALPTAAGLLTLRTGVFARWTGDVALIGALSFLITFLTLIAGTGKTARSDSAPSRGSWRS